MEQRRADGSANAPLRQYTPGEHGPNAAPPQRRGSVLERWKSKGGLLGALASILLVLAKIGAPLFVLLGKLKFLLVALKGLWIFKIALTGGSMLLMMWSQALFYGWPLAIGFVLLILVHECGHGFAARLRGIPTTGMVFIPFLGAATGLKRGGRDIAESAFIAIMGPVFGTIGGIFSVLIYLAIGKPIFLALAELTFFINLFNLAPVALLDGGRIAPVFSSKLLALGVVLLFVIAPRNPLIWILAVLSLPRIISGWKARPETDMIQSSVFGSDDFRDTPTLSAKLIEAKDPVSVYIKGKLSHTTNELLRSLDSTRPPSDALTMALVQEFNNLLQDPFLYDRIRFTDVELRDQTKQLTRQYPRGALMIRYNRLLLEDAYPGEIAKSRLYYYISTADRWKFGLAYFGLAAFLALSVLGLRNWLSLHGLFFA